MTPPRLTDLSWHSRHQILERRHHRFQPPRHFLVGGLEAAHATSLSIEIGKQPVALLAEEANFVSELCYGDATLRIREHAVQEYLKLIGRGVEPLRGPLQSVRLTHRARTSPLRRHSPQSLFKAAGLTG